MISVCGSQVALLGGWRGDRLWLAHSGGAFELLAELGWDETAQTTPQRRIRLTPEACFVLEPGEGAGPMLNGKVRARRFDFDGQETGREEATDDVADPWIIEWLHFLAVPILESESRYWIRFSGVDPESGRACSWSGEADTGIAARGIVCDGVPLLVGDTLWLPMIRRGLLALRRDGGTLGEGQASRAIRIGARGACAAGIRDGVSGVWMDGAWHPLPGEAPFLGSQAPLSPLVATHGDGGVALLRARGGALGVIDGAAARLPEGLYSALVSLPEGLFGVTEGDSPRLVAAVL